MLKTWNKFSLLLLLVFTVASLGCSDGGARSGEGSFFTVTGSVIQGPVHGATVIADKNGNYQLDSNEASTITDENGDFNDLVISENYGPYVLVSVGGVNRITGEPGLTMLAPAGSDNITPVTTLVASAPDSTVEEKAAKAALIEKLNTLAGGSYDADPSVAAPAELVALTKVVEETLYLMQDVGVTEAADQFIVVTEISSQLGDDAVADAANGTDTPLAVSVGQGVVDALPALADSPTTNFSVTSSANEEAFGDIVAAVVAEVESEVLDAADPDGNVTETETLLDAVPDVETIIANDVTLVPIEDIATSVALALESVTLLDASDVETTSEGAATQVQVVLSAFNNTNSTELYDDVSLTLSILDLNSQRSVAFELIGVVLDVTSAVELSDLGVDLDTATLSVTATKSDGTNISTNAVTGAFELFDANFGSNQLVLDLDAVKTLFADQVAAEFATVSVVGDYTITLQATGAPIAPAAAAVTIVP